MRVLGAIFLTVVHKLATSRAMDDNAPLEDAGLNRHEELVVFSCAAVVFVISITIVLFLWYIVDRTKERISQFERHLPAVVGKFREEVAEGEENDHRGRIVMAGSLPVTINVTRGRIRLTSYNRKQDVGIGTDFPENQRASTASNDTDEASNDDLVRGASSKAPDGAESKDFVYIDGEYIPKEFLEGCPPPYAYDNPAYDNPYTENGDGGGAAEAIRMKPVKGKRSAKKKGKGKSNFSVYESHV